MIDEKRLIRDIEINLVCVGDEQVKKHVNETKNVIIGIIKRQLKVNEWIPVEERLPGTTDDVLITCQEVDLELDDGTIFYSEPFIDMARYINGKWFVVNDDRLFDEKILAWQPLPNPYVKE